MPTSLAEIIPQPHQYRHAESMGRILALAFKSRNHGASGSLVAPNEQSEERTAWYQMERL